MTTTESQQTIAALFSDWVQRCRAFGAMSDASENERGAALDAIWAQEDRILALPATTALEVYAKVVVAGEPYDEDDTSPAALLQHEACRALGLTEGRPGKLATSAAAA